MIKEITGYWRDGTFARIFSLLSRRHKIKLGIVVVLQIILSLLDLIGVALIGILGSLTVYGIRSRTPSNLISKFLNLLHISNFTFQTQAAYLGCMAAVTLITRTLLTVILSKATLRFLSYRTAFVTSETVQRLFSSSLLDLQVRSAQQNLYAVTSGIGALFIGVIATSLNMLSDLAVFFVLTVGLALVNPAMAFGTFAFFGVIGLLMFGKLHRKAESLGRNYSQLTIKQNQILLEVLNSYREFLIRARRPFYVEKFRLVRNEIAKTESEINFMPSITKYVMETAVVVGAVIICAIEFLTQDASRAIATLTIFLAAGTRIAPALLRLQQAALNIRNSLGSSHVALDLLGILPPLEHNSEQTGDLDPIYYGFIADAKLKNVDFKYPNSESYAVRNLSLEIEQGSIVAIVGSSGAGKSTLVDLILGILSPENGEILLSGLRPKDAVQTWPGAIAYVPQDILIVEGTVKDNVALGYPESYATNEKVSKAIEIAQLSDFVSSLPNGIDANVGDRGNLLSGGQRQRLGIARALFTSPKFIVLDEATSALDGETEAKLADAINALRGNTTVVLIAHRLSTIRNADTVFYLKDGELIAKGTFEKVRELVPNFDQQASLMGL